MRVRPVVKRCYPKSSPRAFIPFIMNPLPFSQRSVFRILAAIVLALGCAPVFADQSADLRQKIEQALPAGHETSKAAFLDAAHRLFEAERAALIARNAAASKRTRDNEATRQQHLEADKTHEEVRAATQPVIAAHLAALDPFLASATLDAPIVRAALLAHATPAGLEQFSQQGADDEARIRRLLAGDALMFRMLVAGGAKAGRYGDAIRIYEAIRRAHPEAEGGFYESLALAVALEHAEPIPQKNPDAATDAPAIVDPVPRYAHYAQAFGNGELHTDFAKLSVWELRMVVNSDAPDITLAWGREMLRNFRPDHLNTVDPAWRYSKLVKTDVVYGSKELERDLPSLQTYQNILANGGICGRRAVFGRFLLRSFGIPVWGVNQQGHAALGRWTPDGWVVNLGAGYAWSWWEKEGHKRSGSDFLLETQARRDADAYLGVLRAQWISQILGEPAWSERYNQPGGYWGNVAQHRARAIAVVLQAKDLGAVGEELGESNESNESKKPDVIASVELSPDDIRVSIAGDGAITIPAVAFRTDAKPGLFFPVVASCGAKRLHCSRDMKAAQSFDYTFEAPAAGIYQLRLDCVTVQPDQALVLSANAAPDTTIRLPYTVGCWQESAPVAVALLKGKNTLRFMRPVGSRGLTLSRLILTEWR